MLEIILPKPEYLKGYKEYCEEAWSNNITTFRPTNPARIGEWDKNIAKAYKDWANGTKIPKGCERNYHYWAIDGDKFIGEFQFRPYLDDKWANDGGNIGVAVRVSEWNKGYGNQILHKGLKIAKDFGLDKVLITVNEDNFGSIRIIEKNGGVLENKVMAESAIEGLRLVRRYWVKL